MTARGRKASSSIAAYVPSGFERCPQSAEHAEIRDFVAESDRLQSERGVEHEHRTERRELDECSGKALRCRTPGHPRAGGDGERSGHGGFLGEQAGADEQRADDAPPETRAPGKESAEREQRRENVRPAGDPGGGLRESRQERPAGSEERGRPGTRAVFLQEGVQKKRVCRHAERRSSGGSPPDCCRERRDRARSSA